ncbi:MULTISPECIES: iron uptake porin [unclassified Synechococcus]|uniref:iron uptake porin n=1 Tax=unclassified Synechococcus TaxID=2626047 RepID=UPI001CF83D45|nr:MULTISPECIES: iron uptake porin [unclassified Synechococcus]MCB4378236.1 iron uptake porin [Synechococcus sp. MU1650]MCB4410673.1 iron uptake porin [Synechococcus sp. MU1611]
MKLFQQLLVAPAALGLLASGANAAELNINGVSDYAASADQVTSVTQFSDVYPTDWAYQALANLVEQYGCVAGYPNGTFRGNRAMTRYEAAALLNACLDRITEVTDELRRLLKEFETELAILKGRVDGLEARVGELEATQFSTTTKLRGQADFFTGAVKYADRDECNEKSPGSCESDGFSFSYRYTLNLDTSFTGKDRLYTRLRTGNMKNVWTESDSYLADAKSGDNTIKVDKLWYSFPIGNEFKVTVGALIENYYMIETPTRYKPILKAFKLGGYGAVLGASTGQGFGVQWRQDVDPGDAAFNIAVNYVADGGDGAKSGSKKQMFGEDTDAYLLSQVGYGNRKWHVSALYALKNAQQDKVCVTDELGVKTCTIKTEAKAAMGYSTPTAKDLAHPIHAVGLRGYWSPEDSGFIPTISAGLDFGWADSEYRGNSEAVKGWMVGLNWNDAFMEGNKLGLGFGSYSSYATEVQGQKADDQNFAIEGYYDFRVTDNITITPAVFWVDDAKGKHQVNGANKFGGLVKTTFKF